jgi:DNA ligase D-like protein (predicted ligase)
MQTVHAKLFFVPPMECKEIKTVDKLPQGSDWQYEVKFDGYRCIAIKQNNEVELFSRRGLPFKKFFNLYQTLGDQPVKSFVLDGEIVALDETGRSNFNALQNAGKELKVHFYPFDLLNINGEELMNLPLRARQTRLQSHFLSSDYFHKFGPLAAEVTTIIKKIRTFGFEGMIAKQKESLYVPGKTPGCWIKLKLKPTEEFIVGGFIPGAHGLEQLIVGRFSEKKFKYVAALDDGFVPATRRKVFETIKKCAIRNCPFVNLPEKRGRHRMDSEKMKSVTWVAPEIVVEIAMNEWTPDGHLRHAEFKRLRDDMQARQVADYPKDLEKQVE